MTEEEKFYSELAADFFATMRRQIDAAVRRLPEFDWDELHTLGNHLKGSAAIFGQPALSDLGRQLESALENGQNALAFETLRILSVRVREL